jgi:hypothetical protein
MRPFVETAYEPLAYVSRSASRHVYTAMSRLTIRAHRRREHHQAQPRRSAKAANVLLDSLSLHLRRSFDASSREFVRSFRWFPVPARPKSAPSFPPKKKKIQSSTRSGSKISILRFACAWNNGTGSAVRCLTCGSREGRETGAHYSSIHTLVTKFLGRQAHAHS